jgi:hypothetical protein
MLSQVISFSQVIRALTNDIRAVERKCKFAFLLKHKLKEKGKIDENFEK